MINSYPLAWPAGWRRVNQRVPGKFNKKSAVYRDERQADGTTKSVHSYNRTNDLNVFDGVERILGELSSMGFDRDDIVISTNVPTRLDGLPKSNGPAPADPGAAVYWRSGKRTQCMAIDRYTKVQDNLAAIAATLEAMRAIERHGGGEILERAFTGFIALPAPEQWFQVLGVSSGASREEIEKAYRTLAMKHHPDRGGDASQMARINSARDDGLAT